MHPPLPLSLPPRPRCAWQALKLAPLVLLCVANTRAATARARVRAHAGADASLLVCTTCVGLWLLAFNLWHPSSPLASQPHRHHDLLKLLKGNKKQKPVKFEIPQIMCISYQILQGVCSCVVLQFLQARRGGLRGYICVRAPQSLRALSPSLSICGLSICSPSGACAWGSL